MWSGCEAKGDAVKAESLAELGKSAGDVGEKEGVKIDIKRERESVDEERAGEKMEVCGEVFGRVNTSASVDAGGVVDDVEKGIFTGVAGEPSVRRSIVLPKCAEVADLPSADGFIGLFVASIGSEFVSDSPAADGGAVGFKIEATAQFAGDGAVGRRRF